MSINMGDGLPDGLPGENVEGVPGTVDDNPEIGQDVTLLQSIFVQLASLTVAVNALTGNAPQFYTPDYDLSAATLPKTSYFRAATEIMRIEIVGTGDDYPSALTTTPVRVIFGPSGGVAPPEPTDENSVIASVKNDSNKAVARLYVGRVRPTEGQAYLSLDSYASGTKVKVWLYVDGREKLIIPSQEFTAV